MQKVLFEACHLSEIIRSYLKARTVSRHFKPFASTMLFSVCASISTRSVNGHISKIKRMASANSQWFDFLRNTHVSKYGSKEEKNP